MIEDIKVYFEQQDLIIASKMPARLVVTKGLNRGQLFLFDLQSWRHLLRKLEYELEASKAQRSITRFFVADATECEVTVQNESEPMSRLELPLGLFDWAGGFCQGDYTIRKKEEGETWIRHWEICCCDGQIREEETVYQGELRKLQGILEGNSFISADQNKLMLSDGTELEVVTNLGGRRGKPAFVEELRAASGQIQSVRTQYEWIENEESDLQTFEMLVETETETAKILKVRGNYEYGELCCFRIKRNRQQTEA